MKKKSKIVNGLVLTVFLVIFSFPMRGVSAQEEDVAFGLKEEKSLIIQTNSTYDDEEIIELLKLYHQSENDEKEPQITSEDIREFKEHYNSYSSNSYSDSLLRVSFPGYYSYYYTTKTTWLTRSDGITLSVHYIPEHMYIGGNNPNVQAANAANAFDVLTNRHIFDHYWKNTKSMSAQFHCHVVTIGALKNPWNLEPWRTETDLFKTMLKSCNP